MWKCHKCGKPVYFAERRQSLGFNWHPECLRCEECGKRLNPGQHAEHKGVPYCHVPCYGALFGPQLFGHGSRVESHSSFGKMENKVWCGVNRERLDAKLRRYNQYYECRSGEIRSREVNGRPVLEGVLRIYWGVNRCIHLREEDDQRMHVVKRRSQAKESEDEDCDKDSEDNSEVSCNGDTTPSDSSTPITTPNDNSPSSPLHKSHTLPSNLAHTDNWDEFDELLQVERKVSEHEKMFVTLPVSLEKSGGDDVIPPPSPFCDSTPELEDKDISEDMARDDKVMHNNSMDPDKTRNKNDVRRSSVGTRNSISPDNSVRQHSAAEADVTQVNGHSPSRVTLRRRHACRKPRDSVSLKRRCSINGHFYNRETSVFVPPHGSCNTLWVTSLLNTPEVITMLLEKYRVESRASEFSLFVVRDNGEQRRIKDGEYPLLVRVLLGPHEDVAKLFILERDASEVSSVTAMYLNLSHVELQGILEKFYEEEETIVIQTRIKYKQERLFILQRLEELNVMKTVM